MEALQVPIEKQVCGRDICFEHVPATASICSNIAGHTEAVHLVSDGDTQRLIDSMVEILLTQQERASELCRERYRPYLDALQSLITSIEGESDGALAGDKRSSETATAGSSSSKKHKRRRRNEFIDSEASDDGGDDSDDGVEEWEDSDFDDEFIDDGTDSDGDGEVSFYHAFDNRCVVEMEVDGEGEGSGGGSGSSSSSSSSSSSNSSMQNDTTRQKEAEKLKKLKKIQSKLEMYCDQLIVTGFNSQKYDIPLIKNYLPSSLARLDAIPRFVVKKGGGYMVIASPKLKFLDITNYLAAGTSLEKLYSSYDVSIPKGTFPYQWFDSLEKLNATSLPPKEAFFSVLTNKSITDDSYQHCIDVWNSMPARSGVKTFGDYTRYYNDCDVLGLVEAVQKMIYIENENKLDIFKESVSLPGLTQRYLFKNLSDSGDYFVGFGREHKHLYRTLRQNIVGGPSIIFHRYHEQGLTKIKDVHLCEKVIGYDANSLYLYCLAQKMPTGYYSLREKKNNFAKHVRYSSESIQWLEHFRNVDIVHAENSIHGEVRIENFSVDGFDATTKTIYEYYGCFYHGHSCNENHDAVKWQKTLDREGELKGLGYNIVSATSCEWFAMEESKIWYHPEPSNTTCSMDDILDAVKSEELFGFILCDTHVPQHLIAKFSEFPPIFKNSEILMQDIGEHMQEYCRSIARKSCVKRSLISSMRGENVLLLSPLLKKYLEMGLVVTNIECVIEYNGKCVFDWFMNEVVNDRRMADLKPEYAVRGETSKTKGNSGYGCSLMNKFTHTKLTFTKEENVPKHMANPFFKTMQELNGGIYEIEKRKRKVVLDLPTQIGVAVYSYAKLRLLEFWEFINTYLMNDHYQLMECDTDSLYIAFTSENIDECVKPELRDKWLAEKWTWFSSEDEETIVPFNDNSGEQHMISLKQYEKRTPGKFKPEFIGNGMICLNSMVYHIWNDDESKTSCKGVQKRRNQLVRDDFLSVIETQKPKQFENAGNFYNALRHLA